MKKEGVCKNDLAIKFLPLPDLPKSKVMFCLLISLVITCYSIECRSETAISFGLFMYSSYIF
jgi:hypothetical protein